eukprot:38282_1
MGVVCGGDVKDSCDILPDNIFSKLLLESPCQTLTHCLAAKRIAKILNEFSQFKKDPNSCTYETMYQYINELNTLYTNRKLLNDYIHLVTEHQTNEDYEAIHNFLISEMNYKCDITTCNNLQRNQRDRCNDNNIIIQKQLYNTSDPKDVVTQHICDKIHCYFLHTFDLGYRLTENERKTVEIISDTDSDDDDILLATCIDNELRRRQEIIHSKQEQDNNNNNNRNNSDRWILNKNECISRRCFRILNDDPNDFKQEEVYSFGFSFRYGRWNQQNKWFVKPKYENFKCELTNNNTNQLTIDQFNGWLIKALHHLDSDYCKSITFISRCIEVNHLLSIQIYCGADELQRSLTETYRKRGKETDKDLINRHSEYAFWAEYLYQTVNNFGVAVKNASFDKFYHGIDHEMTFESTIAYFHGPLSTSSEYEVALIFANQKGNNGLIIELHNLHQSQAAYFDCAWCSEYAYESEKFFIGGDFGLIIRNIIAPITAQNYEIYIEGLNIIQQMMRGNPYKYTKGKPIPRHVKKCVTKLLRHELYKQSEIEQEEQKENRTRNYKIYCDLPIYIDKSLHYYCSNVIEISIDWRTLNQRNENKPDKGYRFTRDIFVLTEFNESFLDLRAFSLLFPNMYTITITNLRLTRSAMDAMTCYCQQLQLSNSRNPKLNEIIVYRPIKVTDDHEKKPGKEITTSGIDMAVNEYANVFNQYGWQLTKKARFELQITKIKRQ